MKESVPEADGLALVKAEWPNAPSQRLIQCLRKSVQHLPNFRQWRTRSSH